MWEGCVVIIMGRVDDDASPKRGLLMDLDLDLDPVRTHLDLLAQGLDLIPAPLQ